MRRAGYPIDQSALSRYEDEHRVPNVGVLAALAVAYKTPFLDLCSRLAAELTGQPTPPPSDTDLNEEEWGLIQDYRRLKDNPARDPWVALGRALPTIQARADDVVG